MLVTDWPVRFGTTPTIKSIRLITKFPEAGGVKTSRKGRSSIIRSYPRPIFPTLCWERHNVPGPQHLHFLQFFSPRKSAFSTYQTRDRAISAWKKSPTQNSPHLLIRLRVVSVARHLATQRPVQIVEPLLIFAANEIALQSWIRVADGDADGEEHPRQTVHCKPCRNTG